MPHSPGRLRVRVGLGLGFAKGLGLGLGLGLGFAKGLGSWLGLGLGFAKGLGLRWQKKGCLQRTGANWRMVKSCSGRYWRRATWPIALLVLTLIRAHPAPHKNSHHTGFCGKTDYGRGNWNCEPPSLEAGGSGGPLCTRLETDKLARYRLARDTEITRTQRFLPQESSRML